LVFGQVGFAGIELVQYHVRKGESVGIPEDVEHAAGVLHSIPGEVQVLPGCICSQDVEPQDIGPVLLNDLLRLNDIADALGHLAALIVQCEAVHQHALVGRSSKGDHGCSELRVEPATRLVVPFGDEVGRPPPFELLFVRRKVKRGPGGYSAVKPDIEDIGRALHLPATRAVQNDGVHIRPVQVCELLAAFLLQLCCCADHLDMATGRAGPNGQRYSPVSLP